MGWILDQGKVPYVRLMLGSSADTNVEESLFTLGRIVAGDFDADLRRWGWSRPAG